MSPLEITRRTAALGAILLTINVTACGSGGSDEVIARIAGVASINKGMVEHWIPIVAIQAYEPTPRKQLPKGLVPDPSDYKDCIAYLKATSKELGGPQPTVVQLKQQCARKEQQLRKAALDFLIQAEWLIGEGAEEGLTPTDTEINQRLTYDKTTVYPAGAKFQQFLRLTRQTLSDMRFRAKIQLLEVELGKKWFHPSGPGTKQAQESGGKKTAEFTRKWASRTTCHAGYTLSDCKEYKGPLRPGEQ
jgi:hypothetical protein